jgi:hypothetical protein
MPFSSHPGIILGCASMPDFHSTSGSLILVSWICFLTCIATPLNPNKTGTTKVPNELATLDSGTAFLYGGRHSRFEFKSANSTMNSLLEPKRKESKVVLDGGGWTAYGT